MDDDLCRKRGKRYTDLMGELKHRLLHIEKLSSNYKSVDGKHYGEQVFVYESMCLQLRKVLELLAYSTLVANEQAIEPILSDFSEYWRAKAIIKKVSSINPDFFPVSARISEQDHDGTVKALESAPNEEEFSLNEFEALYDACSQVVHSRNPYSSKPMMPVGRPFVEWVQRIRRLLKTHLVYLKRDDIQLVDMLDWSDGRVLIVRLSAVLDPNAG